MYDITIPDSDIFCTVPWYEVHINADGSYHTCGSQRNWITGTPLAEEYNIKRMSIQDWMRGKYQTISRAEKMSGVANDHCGACYKTDRAGGSSKRVRENLKSKINKKDFPITFMNSPDLLDLKNMSLDRMDIRSFHFSLGNECNLQCKTCEPNYSSRIAQAEQQQGRFSGQVRQNWTDDAAAWAHLINTIIDSPGLQFIHVIGGEPLINPKFEELIDTLIRHRKTNTYFGFSTNGTVYREEIFRKLKMFRHVDVGISLESDTVLNDYIRSGSDTGQVIENIKKIQQFQNSNYYVTLRTVVSALSVHEYDRTLKWALENNLGILSNTLEYPPQQQVRNLPDDVKQQLLEHFSSWEFSDATGVVTNGREPELQKFQADSEMRNVIGLLKMPADPKLTAHLYSDLSNWGWLDRPEIRKYFVLDGSDNYTVGDISLVNDMDFSIKPSGDLAR